ncbi:ASCH domain-containing protein [Streptococcus catagoni]|uniref:ASCH domain-containing protein n=1 Tax=Streptococcus catagoni TaxID=2654874 RepID=UPI00140D44F6|nr:ASCH domain-containing protein [Streptococcus catagoni]
MTTNKKVQELWQRFITENSIENGKYEAWQFGFDADLLSQLVLDGKKSATTSAYLFYELEKEDLPQVNEYNIILNSQNDPVCITKTTKVYVTPFNKVSSEHAYKEGEDDRTLASWKKAHQTFFTKELQVLNLEFKEDMEVVCEEFELVYIV